MLITISSRRLWAILIASVAAAAIALISRGLVLDIRSIAPHCLLVGSLLGLSFFRGELGCGSIGKMIDGLEGAGIFTALSTVGALMTYAIAASSAGYVDDSLAAADHMLGFDWLYFYNVLQRHRLLDFAMVVAYKSIFWTPFVLIFLHVNYGLVHRMRIFICVFSLALFITISLFYWFPAQSAVPHYIGANSKFLPPSGWPTIVIERLRSGATTTINMNEIIGMITFPSFHAVSAVVFIWSALPFRRSRQILIPLNVMMLVATPIEGSHYLIDVIGGAALASICIGLAYMPTLQRSVSRLLIGNRPSFPQIVRT